MKELRIYRTEEGNKYGIFEWNGIIFELKPICGFLPENTRLLHIDGQIFFTDYDQRFPEVNQLGEPIKDQIIRVHQNKEYPKTFYTQDLAGNFWGVLEILDNSALKFRKPSEEDNMDTAFHNHL